MARDRLRNPSINAPQSREEARQAIIHKARRLLTSAPFSLGYVFTTDAGLGVERSHESATWLNEEQAVILAQLEDLLDRLDANTLADPELTP